MIKQLFLLLLIGCACSLQTVRAQEYHYEVGVGLGLSSYYGDLNGTRFFYKPSFAFEGIFRYQYNMRWAFVGEFLTAGLRGDSRDFDSHFPEQAQYAFSSRLWQLAGRSEFHFLNYGIGPSYKNMRRLSPFISAGIGLGIVSGDGENSFSFSIPLGVGVKYRIAPRWGVGLRFDFAKQLTDQADGIKDPMGIESGLFKNTEWYSTLQMSVCYQFGLQPGKCHNRD